MTLLPPANEVCKGYVFTGVCPQQGGGVRGCSGGLCMVASRGGMRGCSRERAWLLWGGMCGCSEGGHAWLLQGGVHGFCQGGAWCAWFLLGGVHGFCWGACGFFRGVCMVFSGGACMVFPGRGACIGYDEIRSMSGQYASYWNAFLFCLELAPLDPLISIHLLG